MQQFRCPLCSQPVSKTVYERITGIWRVKEERLAKLRIREKQLVQQEQDMAKRFARERRKQKQALEATARRRLEAQKAQFEGVLHTQKKKIEAERAEVQRKYRVRLAKETDRVLRAERASQRRMVATQIRKATQLATERERTRLSEARAKMERQERLAHDRHARLLSQFKSSQAKSESALTKQALKIKSLQEQLEESKTPQVLGLLEEGVLLGDLEREFKPPDRFDHTGKGGDIVHHVIADGVEVGRIVYELKKVSTFSSKHVDQALRAKHHREADYAILVTNATRTKKASGFFVERGVIVVFPAATLVLVGILRTNIVTIAKMKLAGDERRKAVRALLGYVQGAQFRNAVEGITQYSIDLYEDMKKEVERHVKSWEFRLEKYRGICRNSSSVQSNVLALTSPGGTQKPAKPTESIESIALPEKIEPNV